ncbi:helix-turn-helix domain-containing protein [Glycomyces scopariae]|uniref:MarR family protein n=1 Tax=Glycomyces sambucus TaxID=380244 RepID=A0A1G9F3N1_9ACTN|nr:helix-turn-helix domain-containing protein [Glycomyces sambucus]SDK82958.1 MarR family protein [Glycomyces sambucus]
MPGGRLTYEERRAIADGVARGRSCAEIARGLDRPASTVSREVARNGGARRYRANLAEQAARWRARRRAPHPEPSPGPRSDEAAPAADRHGFGDRFAATMVRTGVPAMAAKVLARLYTSDAGSLPAADLAAAMRVSPASVAKGAGWLVERGMVAREREGRRVHYRIDDEAAYRAWRTSLDGMAAWAELTGQGADLLGDATPAGARLRDTARFFDLLGRDMAQAAEHWRRISTGR